MEIFIIIVAVIAVVSALLLLLLLQIRIKKQTAEGSVVQGSCEASSEEIAAPDPNDPYLKTGPPPYREVMKSPDRYPLSSSPNLAFGEAKIQISSPSRTDNERSKRTWAQLMTAVLRPDDMVPSSPPGKHTNGYDTNPISSTLRNTKSEGSTKNIDSCDVIVDETPNSDEVLPTYHEVCSAGVTVEPADNGQRNRSTQASECELGQCKPPTYNRDVERTILSQKSCAFTVSNTLQSVIVEAGLTRSRSLPTM